MCASKYIYGVQIMDDTNIYISARGAFVLLLLGLRVFEFAGAAVVPHSLPLGSASIVDYTI